MSTLAQRAAGEAAGAASAPGRQAGYGLRRKLAVAGGLTVIAAAAGVVAATGLLRAPQAAVSHGVGGTSLAAVTEQSLSSQIQVNATLGYVGTYNVLVPAASGGQPAATASGTQSTGAGQTATRSGTAQPAATFTALPDAGTVVREGQRLYSVNGTPVVLLYGSTPAYRSLAQGASGTDVRQLNADLVALGDAARSRLSPHSDYFSAATARALAKLQARLGVLATGSLPVGQAIFLPTAARVTSVSAALGGPAQPGTPVLQASSTARQITAQLDASQQAAVKPGDRVSITLPGNQTTPGVVTTVGTAATSAPSSPGSSGAEQGASGSGPAGSPAQAATVNVSIKPVNPSATGTLDQAPVQVTITTATVNRALVAPVDALLARPHGGYAVEAAGAHGARHLVPVSLGIFDDADGLVQVSGPGLSAGQRVVVPKI